jgi:hypothetical protein
MFLGSKVRPVRGADNLTAIYLTSHNPIGLYGLLRGWIYFIYIYIYVYIYILSIRMEGKKNDTTLDIRGK